jgi:hypothetical protein
MLVSLASVAAAAAAAATARFVPPVPVGSPGVLPSTANCSVHYHTQPLDHFAEFAAGTYQQRYYVYDKWWTGGAKAGPVFFYVGNEVRDACYNRE